MTCRKTLPLLITLALLLATTAAGAQTFTTLISFDGVHGESPNAGLVQATDGNLYGTTYNGGVDFFGTVFKITTAGALTSLHSFDLTDGALPYAGLVQASNGILYGTAQQGGANQVGTVFKITLSGTLTTLHSFDTTDGWYPYAGLIQASNGNLYGTTYRGGANNDGTVFKITQSGTLTSLHSFDSTDGDQPEAGLIQATNGNLYGMTGAGGNGSQDGTVFKITQSGTLTSLHTFVGTDGSFPAAGLVQGSDGNFYGTTSARGANGFGTVFRITPSGTLTTLYNFAGTDGTHPADGLIQATDGNLYGTTDSGGAHSGGTIFKITPSGTLTTLYNFCSQSNCADGSDSVAGLVQDTNGIFYGTTFGGGTSSFGTVFSLSVGLGPFVETQTASGKVGAAVKILGTKLTGATSVKFNGTAATFRVVSKSLITTTVPTGATTGFVTVTTPRGTLKSNRKFRVTP
jgi:uncharacterized repeat protein (TIGR03803 family)